MIIDVFSHLLPPKYFEALQKKAKSGADFRREKGNPANINLDMRMRVMDRHPEVLQVLTISQPALETTVSPSDAAELAKAGNDELAEILLKYPDKFLAGVACLPLNDLDATLKEVDRAINDLKFRGVQIYSTINGETLDSPKFKPLYEKMAKYDLPIWIHPCMGKSGDESVFGWPFETSHSMLRLVAGGILEEYPNLKFITHHCGAMVSFFEQRINWLYPLEYKKPNPLEQFKKFYCDTAVYGSTPALMCAQEFFGVEHILYGTDFPLGPRYGLTVQTIDSVNRMNISDNDKAKILYQNAVRILRTAI
jgi:uncharacterized protein